MTSDGESVVNDPGALTFRLAFPDSESFVKDPCALVFRLTAFPFVNDDGALTFRLALPLADSESLVKDPCALVFWLAFPLADPLVDWLLLGVRDDFVLPLKLLEGLPERREKGTARAGAAWLRSAPEWSFAVRQCVSHPSAAAIALACSGPSHVCDTRGARGGSIAPPHSGLRGTRGSRVYPR